MTTSISTTVAVLCFSVLQQTACAQDSTNANSNRNMVGIRISSKDATVNHSITYKHFFKKNIAVEGLFSFSDPGAFGILVEKHKALGVAGLTWFWGAGGYLGFSSGHRFGAQGAIGLDLLPSTLPINLSIDWKPELNFTKTFSFEPSALGFNARFVF